MADQAAVIYPLFAHLDSKEASKYTPPSTTKTSLYESESPLGAHSSTTSSRLSGSYEPSQVSSMVDELNSDLAQMRMGESATHTTNASHRPYLHELILPSNMPPNQGRANPIHAPYSNVQSYANYFPVVGSPVIREHPGYPYGPMYASTEQHPSFPSHYNSPPIAHAAPYPHPQMPRRASVGVYYNYEFGANAPLSPGSPFGYHHHHTVSPPMVFMPPMPAQQYPASPPLVPAPATRQVRPLVSSPLRPLEAANSSNAGNNSRRHGTASFSSASTFGHQASLLVNRNHRRDQRETQTQARSTLLSDFKNNKSKRWDIRDFKGGYVEFSKDQHGSRFIQQQYPNAGVEVQQWIFAEIVPQNALALMNDVFGNYVIQKLFEHGTPLQIQELCNVMTGNILTLSLEMYGCRVVQKAIDCGTPEQQSAIVSELSGHILKCVKDSNGNHVIQRLLERVSLERMAFIFAFTGNVYELATHPYGCRVLQRCFEHASPDQVVPLLEELHSRSLDLMQDQFGNYVVQWVLAKGSHTDRQRLVDSIFDRILLLSRHKFASNVCEKAIVAADGTRKYLIVKEMLATDSNGTTPVSIMIKDQYANYVLQTALKSVEGEPYDELLREILRSLTYHRQQPGSYNNRQLTSIERFLKEKGVALEDRSALRLVVPTRVAQEGPKSGSPTP